MIYLRSRNLIFIKPRKTAGTSVEIALSANASEEDVVTPISPEDELLRLQSPYQFPVNWAADVDMESQYFNDIKLCKTGGISMAPVDKAMSRFFHHMSPHEIELVLGEQHYSQAYKVSMVRHPYEQLVSQAYWRASQPGGKTFNEEIEFLLENPQFSNSVFYFDGGGGELQIDFVIRYEELLEGLEQLENKFELKLIEYLPYTKHTSRVNRAPAHRLLSVDQMKRCFARSRDEFETFDYDSYF